MGIWGYLLIGAGGALLFKLFHDRHKAKSIVSWGEMAMGEINKERHLEKEGRKSRIMRMFDEKPNLTNNQIEKMLGVSDASVTRYLEELEKEGRIVQEASGRKAFYRKA